ncbi:glycosyltransferase [Frankia sp. QA3]|uniref:glycosyltransferase n=1 Tax=Frankia sp. QA3 TaxID=710111 RepID=UPI001E58A72A|nr:glycosyltransferase [Frankia sp. QA3]
MIVSAPLLGHLLPMVPTAQALRAAGHEVLLAAGGDALAVRQSGFAVDDVAPGIRIGRLAGGVLLRHPLLGRAELAGRAGTRMVARLFAEVNRRMAPAVRDRMDRFRPDLVLYEPLAVAGALAAGRGGEPAVLHENSLFDGPELVRATAARLGVDPPGGLPGAGVVTIAPPRVVGVRAGWPMSGVPHPGLGTLPDWLREPPAAARILVSRSTVAGPGGSDVMRAVVRVAARADAEIVLVRPERAVLRRPLPARVRAVDWIPINQALPGCAGVVHHGGAGSVLGALAAGVPQLVVPGSGDRRHNAELVAASGAGLAVAARDITADVLARLVTDPRLATTAREVRREMLAMPAPAELVPRLAALAG